MTKLAPRIITVVLLAALVCADAGCVGAVAAFYFARGTARFNKGDYDHAIADFNQVIALKHQLTHAYSMRSLCYYKKGDYVQALADGNQAVAFDANSAAAYQARALAYFRLGQLASARADLQQVIRLAQNERLRASAVKLLNAINARAPAATDRQAAPPEPVLEPSR